jgi:hypothetical protein
MNNITSPRTDDSGIEQMIQAKGLTAPRVTPADVKAAIANEYYFTADEGVIGRYANRMEQEGFTTTPQDLPKRDPQLLLLTFCVLTLSNGFTVTGESACVSAENFDADIGRKVARENAVQKIWPLMGYALKDRIHAEEFRSGGV